MAKESSFDVVSDVDMQEVDNAYGQALRELKQRYDLKDSGAQIDLDKGKETITINAPSDFVGNQVIDVLQSKLVRRGVDLKSISWSSADQAAGGTVRIVGTVIRGIDSDIARKINKDIKNTKLKVKVTIEGEKLRVSGTSKDALQDVIGYLKEQDYGLPLQFTNYR